MRDISTEQIRLAVSKHVLAMRTIDLLNLMNLRECGKLSSQKIQAILEKEAGLRYLTTAMRLGVTKIRYFSIC